MSTYCDIFVKSRSDDDLFSWTNYKAVKCDVLHPLTNDGIMKALGN